MRYALTFTSDPNAYDWGDTDTIIVETELIGHRDTQGRRWYDVPASVEKVLIKYGRSPEQAREIANSDHWFVRNVDDVDVAIDLNNQAC